MKKAFSEICRAGAFFLLLFLTIFAFGLIFVLEWVLERLKKFVRISF